MDLEDKIPKPKKPLSFSDQSRIGDMQGQLNTINNILWAAVIVMLIMVGNILIDSWNNKGASYQSLINQVNDQNYKIEDLKKTVNLVCKTWRKDCPN